MEMFEHMNAHVVMKHHELRRKELLDEVRRERLKNEVMRRAAQEQRSVFAGLWQHLRAQLGRIRPAVPPRPVRVDECVGFETT
jgi:hypothetical protein